MKVDNLLTRTHTSRNKVVPMSFKHPSSYLSHKHPHAWLRHLSLADMIYPQRQVSLLKCHQIQPLSVRSGQYITNDVELKSHERSFVHDIHFICLVFLKFCTEDGRLLPCFCAKKLKKIMWNWRKSWMQDISRDLSLRWDYYNMKGSLMFKDKIRRDIRYFNSLRFPHKTFPGRWYRVSCGAACTQCPDTVFIFSYQNYLMQSLYNKTSLPIPTDQSSPCPPHSSMANLLLLLLAAWTWTATVCDGKNAWWHHDSSWKHPGIRNFHTFVGISLSTQLNKRLGCRWFKTSRRSCDVIVTNLNICRPYPNTAPKWNGYP